MCLTAKNFGLKEQNINISNPQGKTTNLENGMGYHRERERETDGEKERHGSSLEELGGCPFNGPLSGMKYPTRAKSTTRCCVPY